MTPPRNRAKWLIIGFLVVSFSPASAVAQENLWKKSVEAAHEALRKGRPAEAERWLRSALVEAERSGQKGSRVATTLNDLAVVYQFQGKYAESEPLLRRALAIHEKAGGSEHPLVASTLHNLGMLYRAQRRYAEAKPVLQRALGIRGTVLGSEHPSVAETLSGLAWTHREEGNLVAAESLYRRALAIRENTLGPEHPLVAANLHGLAELYSRQGKYREAESLFERALGIREKARITVASRDVGSPALLVESLAAASLVIFLLLGVVMVSAVVCRRATRAP